MNRFDPSRSLLAGMDAGALLARLNSMQQDYLDLSQGRKLESASYSQVGGSKAVTYTPATLPALAQAIRLLQQQLGLVDRPRMAIRVRF